MKLLRTLALPLMVLSLAVSCGKPKPEGTTPPGETGSGDATAGGGDAGGDGGDGGDGGGGDAGAATGDSGGDAPAGPDASKVCDSEVSDPKTFFGDSVLVRLPKGVELVEDTPFFARITSKNTVSVCDAIVSYAAVSFFQADPAKPITQVRDETLTAARGFQTSEVTWADEVTKGREYAGSFQVPEGPKGEPPIKGWFVIKEKYGKTFFLAFETHPNAWNAVKKSFEEAGKRLLITKNAQ